jgi:AAA family ATP:ADP antiporter
MPIAEEPVSPALTLAARVLGIRPGEVGRGLLLFTYLLLVIGSFIVGKAARDALFLYQFSALQLPYVDIAVAVLVSVWMAGYIRAGQYLSLRSILHGSLLFFASNAVVFWYASRHYEATWLLPVIYIWVGMFGVIAPAQVWTLANYVLTTREAKRLFGLIGSGATIGAIAGGFLVGKAATRFGTENTLLGMALALVAATVVVDQLWRRRHLAQRTIGEEEEEPEHPTVRTGTPGLAASLRLIAGSRYLQAIAAVICLSSLVTAIAAWQFKAVARSSIPDLDALTAFFGGFNFWTGLAALALQLLLTSRLLRRLGLGFTLFVVPVALTTGSIATLALGSLGAVVLLRGSDQVLRYSIDRPTVELLYLPVPADQTFQVKSFIDTVVWRLGDGLAGLTVLVFAALLHWSVIRVSWVNLLLLGGWLVAAWVARRLYIVNLRDSIYHYRIDAERASTPLLERAASDILTGRLESGDTKQILYALSLFGASHGEALHPAVRGLLTHPSPEVRRAAVELLDSAGDRAVQSDVERLLYDPDLGVRTAAMLYVAHHARIDPLERIEQLGSFADFSIRSAMVSFLTQPGPTQNLEAAHVLFSGMVHDPDVRTQSEAARLAALLPADFVEDLEQLVRSPDVEVAAPALQAAGRLRAYRLTSAILPRLAESELADEAVEALGSFGDRILGTLREALAETTTSIEVRRQIPAVLLRIGSAAAEHLLGETLLDGDTTLRFHALAALNKLRATGSSRPLDTRLVETVLAAEIMGHLRSYQMLGTLQYPLDSAEPLAPALRESMTQEVERIFRLIKLLHPAYDLHSAFVGLQSENRAVHDNALEFLDNVLAPHLRALIVPLLDSEVTITQRLALADRVLGTRVESREAAVTMLASSPDPWLQSCAAYAIGVLRLTSLSGELDRFARSEDPLLRETARQAQTRLQAAKR